MSSNFSHAVPFVPVRDLKETINYYRDQLGFNEEWFWEDTDAGIRRNDLRLLFMHDPEFVSRINSNGRHFEICWFVNNVEEVYDEYKKKDIRIVSPLESKPWQMKEFTIEEINGYWIRIGTGI
jgi:catechol 2,3-dioxygenase-like lactoylglutathione lyase family enzyme